MIAKAVTRRSESNGDMTSKEPNENIEQYKEMIRVQDRRVNELSAENENLKEQIKSYAIDADQLRQQVYELQQQNTELKLKVRLELKLQLWLVVDVDKLIV